MKFALFSPSPTVSYYKVTQEDTILRREQRNMNARDDDVVVIKNSGESMEGGVELSGVNVDEVAARVSSRPQSEKIKKESDPMLSSKAEDYRGVDFMDTLDDEELAKSRINARPSTYRAYKPMEKDVAYSVMGNIALLGLGFGAAVFCLGEDFMLIGGAGFSVWILWQASVLVGIGCKEYGIPPLLGNLIIGIVLKNLPGGVVDGLPDTWASIIRATGLSLILMRSGLELDVPMVIQQGWVAARLTILPGFVEAMTTGAVAHAIFGMPIALAFALGFILAAVSPAVVVGGMFNLQKKGYGTAKGIPSLVVAAASFDDVVAISGYSMCIGSAIHTGHDTTMQALDGPINIIAGILAGLIGGTICGMTRMFNTQGKRTLICILMGLFLMYLSLVLHYHGAGALAGLMTTITASYCWQNETLNKYFPQLEPSLPANDEWHHTTEHDIAMIWEFVASPLLFAVIGASIDFSKLDLDVIPYSLAVVCVGAAVRVPTAILVTGGRNLTFIERCFVGLSWIPKATVQAALGSVPLDIVMTYMSEDDDDYDEYKRWGEQILVTAVVAILVTAPIGLICINVLGERWLTYDADSFHYDDGHIYDEVDSNHQNGDSINLKRNDSTDSAVAVPGGLDSLAAAAMTKHKQGGERSTSVASQGTEDQPTIQFSNTQESFLEGVTNVYAAISGVKEGSAADEKALAHDEARAMARRLGIGRRKKKKAAAWEVNQSAMRMTTAAKRQLNKRLTVHYFHRVTDHCDSVERVLRKARDTSDLRGGLTPKDVEDLDLDAVIASSAAVMDAAMACFNVIDKMGENFPASRLYEELEDMKSMDQSKRRSSKTNAAFDAVSGTLVYEPSMSGDDPMDRSMEVLRRRGSSVLPGSLSRANSTAVDPDA